jgi:uroporphyrinogen-III synthase
VLELPLLRYSPLPPPADVDPAAFDWILFTSPQGVRAFADAGLSPGTVRVGALGGDTGGDTGGGTAAALADHGWRDDLGARCRDGVELVRAFVEAGAAPARVLLPGPDRRLPEPAAALRAAGCTVVELPLYRTEPIPAVELPGHPFEEGDLVFFASPSAVGAFAAAYALRPPCVAIGETTAAAARAAGFDPLVADAPDLSAMALACGLDPVTDPSDREMPS